MAFQSFPLSDGPAAPAYYTTFEWTARNGIHYEGDTVVATLSQATATDYDVVCLIESHHAGYDLGDVVASGSVTGTTLTLGTFAPGCYRVRLYGASTDADYGDSYGASNFAVIRANGNFPTLPASVGNPAEGGGYIPRGQGGAFFDDPVELITKACLGLGTSRFSVSRVSDPNSTGSNKLSDVELAVAVHDDYWWNPSFDDPVRERKQWCAFPNGTTDLVRIQPNYLDVAVRDASVDGTKVFISATSGGGTGGSDIIHVYYPNSSTLVETYDNLLTQTDAITAINGVSNYIWVWRFGVNDRLTTRAVAAIGAAYADGIRTIVSTLYPLGVTHFEGPSNEPSMSQPSVQEAQVAAHHMRLMQGFVHQGHPDAKAIGPSSVDIASSATPDRWREYLQNWVDFSDEPDGFAFHDYNSIVNGDINCGRNTIEAWADVLAEFGWEDKERWQTEATHNISSVAAGVYHPGRSSVTMAMILLWDQYGIPFERNPIWYDYSHGFWSYPAWLFHGYSGDKSPNPNAITASVFAQEIFGKVWSHGIDFRHVVANRMFIGNVYGTAADDGSVAVMMCASWMPNSTVTLQILGSDGAIVVVDAAGNEQSYVQTAGEITVPVTNNPTYVRLPVGVNARVSHIRDWSTSEPPSVSVLNTAASLGGLAAAGIGDDEYLSLYLGGTSSTGISHSAVTTPDAAIMFFAEDKTVARVVSFHGPAWEEMPYPLEHTVETIPSGTVLPTSATAFAGTGTNDASAGNVAWASPTKIIADDGDFSNAGSMTAGQTSQYLNATNFGFAVPGGATILGVVVNAKCGTSGGTDVNDQTVQLIDAGVRAGDNNAATAWPWFPMQVKTWGGSEDLWGIALTPAKVNAANFGVSIRVSNASALASPAVDYVQIIVYYTQGPWPLPWAVKASPVAHVASSVLWGTNGTNAGCQRETFTQEPWITDDSFTGTPTQGVKYGVTDLSYGGEPDTNCIVQGGLNLSGHGMAVPKMALQEVVVLSATPLVVGSVPTVPAATRLLDIDS